MNDAPNSLDTMFKERWSTRSFDGSPLSDSEKQVLLEAARSAPSCYNEQPWFFVYATDDESERKKFIDLLAPPNQAWAANAGMLCFVLANRGFNMEGNPAKGQTNRHYAFDSGTAWGYLALQAHKLGLSAHAMGGFNLEASYDVLQIDKSKWEVMAAIAIGRPTDEARENEERSSRKPLNEISGLSLNS